MTVEVRTIDMRSTSSHIYNDVLRVKVVDGMYVINKKDNTTIRYSVINIKFVKETP